MAATKVLITTSGLGSRLGDITKYTNKALVKIGDKAAISHIIDMYDDASFVITLGHFGSQVRQFLELTYPFARLDLSCVSTKTLDFDLLFSLCIAF